MEMYSSGRKRSHSKCDRSARARGFDSHHLRLQYMLTADESAVSIFFAAAMKQHIFLCGFVYPTC